MCRSAIKKKNHRLCDAEVFITIGCGNRAAAAMIWTIDQQFFSIILVFLFVSFYHSVVRQQWLFLSDTKRVTRLLLPWRPCLDSKLWTKSRSDIKRAFGTQIISRPESCCLNNNVNKKVRQKNANGK